MALSNISHTLGTPRITVTLFSCNVFKRLADELLQLENREGHQEQVTSLVAQEQTLQEQEREQNETLQGIRLRWEQSRLLLEQSKKEVAQIPYVSEKSLFPL